MGDDVREAVILIQRFVPDEYFTEADQLRKRELLTRRTKLTKAESVELEKLLDVELEVTVARTDWLAAP